MPINPDELIMFDDPNWDEPFNTKKKEEPKVVKKPKPKPIVKNQLGLTEDDTELVLALTFAVLFLVLFVGTLIGYSIWYFKQ